MEQSTVKTPIVAKLKIAGVDVEVHALTLGLVRRASQAETSSEQLEAVQEIVDAVAVLPFENSRPSDIFGIEDCNRIVEAATGTATGTAKDADFQEP